MLRRGDLLLNIGVMHGNIDMPRPYIGRLRSNRGSRRLCRGCALPCRGDLHAHIGGTERRRGRRRTGRRDLQRCRGDTPHRSGVRHLHRSHRTPHRRCVPDVRSRSHANNGLWNKPHLRRAPCLSITSSWYWYSLDPSGLRRWEMTGVRKRRGERSVTRRAPILAFPDALAKSIAVQYHSYDMCKLWHIHL